jgi:alpha-1,3-rhamnosyl/mannosyltransferase
VIAADASVPGILATAVTTFAPGDVSTLRLLLERAIRDPAAFRPRAEAAMAIARTYTWDRCAQATAEVYRETLSAA